VVYIESLIELPFLENKIDILYSKCKLVLKSNMSEILPVFIASLFVTLQSLSQLNLVKLKLMFIKCDFK